MVFEKALAVTFWKPAAATKNEAFALLSVQYSETSTNPLNPTSCWAHMQLLVKGCALVFRVISALVLRRCICIGSHERDPDSQERKENTNMHIPLAAAQLCSFPLAMSVLGRSSRTVQHYGSCQCCSGVGEQESVAGAKILPASPWKLCLYFTLQLMYNSTHFFTWRFSTGTIM